MRVNYNPFKSWLDYNGSHSCVQCKKQDEVTELTFILMQAVSLKRMSEFGALT